MQTHQLRRARAMNSTAWPARSRFCLPALSARRSARDGNSPARAGFCRATGHAPPPRSEPSGSSGAQLSCEGSKLNPRERPCPPWVGLWRPHVPSPGSARSRPQRTPFPRGSPVLSPRTGSEFHSSKLPTLGRQGPLPLSIPFPEAPDLSLWGKQGFQPDFRGFFQCFPKIPDKLIFLTFDCRLNSTASGNMNF